MREFTEKMSLGQVHTGCIHVNIEQLKVITCIGRVHNECNVADKWKHLFYDATRYMLSWIDISSTLCPVIVLNFSLISKGMHDQDAPRLGYIP